MTTIISVHENLTASDALEKIEFYTKQAADAVKAYMQRATIEEYKHFLDAMYHYTINTGSKAREASENVNAAELKAFFLHFEEEEAWHFKLARDDLKTFGLTPSANKPSSILEFDAFWASLKGRHDNWYLGALYVFENIGKYVTADVGNFIKRLNLSKAQCRWLSTHAEADIDHGQEVEKMIQKYISDEPSAAVESAKQASHLWINIMTYAFQLPKAA